MKVQLVQDSMKPFTYIKDIFNFIYYIEREAVVDGTRGFVLSACIYHPSPLGTRRQLTSGTRYDKLILHGMDYEHEYIKNIYQKEAMDRVLSLRMQDPITLKTFLFMPADEVVEIYDPRESKKDIYINHKYPEEYNQYSEAIEIIMNLFAEAGVPRQAISLYGGLQCFLFNETANIRDIDILIDGYHYYEAVKKISADNPADSMPPTDHAKRSPIWQDVLEKRRIVSQFKVPGMDNVICDVRIVSDEPATLPVYSDPPKKIELKNALVVESQKSLSIPYSYKVNVKEKDYEVVGTFYHYLSAAIKGDTVNVCGAITDDNKIEILDPTTHFIYAVTT